MPLTADLRSFVLFYMCLERLLISSDDMFCVGVSHVMVSLKIVNVDENLV